MKNKSTAFITEAVFKQETTIIHSDIQSLKNEIKSLATKDSVNKLALAVVNLQGEVAGIKNDMKNLATKDDIHRVLNQMTDFSKETHTVLQNQEVHRGYIHDHEERLIALEKRTPLS